MITARRSNQGLWLRSLILASAIPLAACSGAAGPDDMPSGGDGGNGSSGDHGHGGAAGDDGFINPSSGSGGGDMTACATSSSEATLVPINLFLPVAKSGSMGDNRKWTNAKAAFLA